MSFKITIIGDNCVGKTSLIHRYVYNYYNNLYKSTIGVDFFTKNITINNTKINLQLWDTSGNEKFHTLSNAFYRGSDACIIVFDLTNYNTFKNLENWMDEFLLYSNISNPYTFPFIIIGNKSDLITSENIVINDKVINKFCTLKNVKYFEISAKMNENINIPFKYLINKLHKNIYNEPKINLYDIESLYFYEYDYTNSKFKKYDSIKINDKDSKKYLCC